MYGHARHGHGLVHGHEHGHAHGNGHMYMLANAPLATSLLSCARLPLVSLAHRSYSHRCLATAGSSWLFASMARRCACDLHRCLATAGSSWLFASMARRCACACVCALRCAAADCGRLRCFCAAPGCCREAAIDFAAASPLNGGTVPRPLHRALQPPPRLRRASTVPPCNLNSPCASAAPPPRLRRASTAPPPRLLAI